MLVFFFIIYTGFTFIFWFFIRIHLVKISTQYGFPVCSKLRPASSPAQMEEGAERNKLFSSNAD